MEKGILWKYTYIWILRRKMRHMTALYISRHFIVLSLLLWFTLIISMTHKKCFGPRQKHSPFRFFFNVYIKKWKKSHIGLYKFHYCSKVSVIIDCLHKKGWKNPTSLYEFYNCSTVSVFVNTDFFLCSIYIYIYILHVGTVFFLLFSLAM